MARPPLAEQAAVRKLDPLFQILPFLVLQLKGSGCTKADRGDDGIDPKFGLVICMPGDAVFAGSVSVKQDAVERDSGRHRLTNESEHLRP